MSSRQVSRNIKKKQEKEIKDRTKVYKKQLVEKGVDPKAVDTLIRKYPDSVEDSLTYGEILKAYNTVSANIKYTRDILNMVKANTPIEGVNVEEHDRLVDGAITNVEEILSTHLEPLEIYTKYSNPPYAGDAEIALDDAIAMADLASIADLSMVTLEEIQVVLFMALVPNVGMDINDMGGV